MRKTRRARRMRGKPCADAVAAQKAVAFIDDGRPMLQQAEIAAPAARPFQKLLADRRLRQGNRQSVAPLYETFCKQLSELLGKPVGTGEFGADMKVELLNDGPVTICMDTKNKE